MNLFARKRVRSVLGLGVVGAKAPSFVGLLGLLAGPVFAQTVSTYNLTMRQLNSLTAEATISGTPAYYINAGVQGSGLTEANSASSFTPPGKAAVNLGYAGGGWNYNSSSADLAAFSAAFPMGTFTFTIGVGSGTLALSGTFLDAQTVWTNQGSWTSGGGGPRLLIDPAASIRFSWTNPAGYVNGDGIQLMFLGPGDIPAFTGSAGETYYDVPANTFLTGSYGVNITFFRTVGTNNTDFGAAHGVAMLGTQTSFSMQAVPEPTRCVALFGLAALGFAAFRRRQGCSQRVSENHS